MIQIDDQQAWKENVTQKLSDSIRMQIDGQPAKPIIIRANFVTIGVNGIFTRQTTVLEPLAAAVLGVAFVYETLNLAQSVTTDWDLFSADMAKVPATMTDPFGSRQHYVTADEPSLHWKSRLAGYRILEVKQVEVITPAFPVASLCFAALATVGYLWSEKGAGIFFRNGPSGAPHKTFLTSFRSLSLAVAVVLYPFAWTMLALLLGTAFKPDSEGEASILGDLLTNVYRSFDLRNENAIHDRLAVSLTGAHWNWRIAVALAPKSTRLRSARFVASLRTVLEV